MSKFKDLKDVVTHLKDDADYLNKRVSRRLEQSDAITQHLYTLLGYEHKIVGTCWQDNYIKDGWSLISMVGNDCGLFVRKLKLTTEAT